MSRFAKTNVMYNIYSAALFLWTHFFAAYRKQTVRFVSLTNPAATPEALFPKHSAAVLDSVVDQTSSSIIKTLVTMRLLERAGAERKTNRAHRFASG